MNYTSANNAEYTAPDLELMVSLKGELERNKAEQKWMLISPAGEVWADADPMILCSILAREKMRKEDKWGLL